MDKHQAQGDNTHGENFIKVEYNSVNDVEINGTKRIPEDKPPNDSDDFNVILDKAEKLGGLP
ncbi:hypothetical protein HAX54_045093, partial [Datura stramonium]|nr:hypothetical protein [Datura stramonium]